MNELINEIQVQNCLKLMDAYVQKKHLIKISNQWKIKARVRNLDWYNEIISAVLFGLVEVDDLCNWLSSNQLDGSNHFFVHDVDLLDITDETFQPYIDFYKNNRCILDVNIGNLKQTTLVNAFKIENKFILSFLAPAQISKKILTNEGLSRSELEGIIYPGFVEFDIAQKTAIVILNTITNLDNVEGRKLGKYNSYTPIVNLFLENARKVIGHFYVKRPVWLTNSLYYLAEEATYHNNPDVENKKAIVASLINKFSTRLLQKNGINDDAYSSYLTEEILSCYETILLDEYGDQNPNDIGVFLQKTDQLTTSIEVESITQNLNSGAAGRIAKQSRQDSDLKKLGIDIKTNEFNRQRFFIEDGKDHVLIRPLNNTFTEREVVLYVLSKLYKHKTRIPLK